MSELTGSWKKASYVVENLDKLIKAPLIKATAKNALLVEAALVKHIQNQDLGWAALNPAYKKFKEKKKLSSHILIATSTLLNSVTTQIIEGGMAAFVGVLRTAKGKGGRKEVMIAAVHEYGSAKRNIDARPLFRPTFKEMKPIILENYKKALEKALAMAVKGG